MAKETLAAGLGRPAQYAQASRKGKKSWRKNIDLTATEAALEDLREQERTFGTPAHTQPNQALFVEDRAGQETQLARQAREKRKLKSQEILAMRSAAPAVSQRHRSSFQLDTKSPAGKAAAAGLPAKMKRRLRILASRPHDGLEGEDERGTAGKFQSDAALAEKHDIWSEPEPTPANEWLSPAAHKAILVSLVYNNLTQRPRSLGHEPHAVAKSVPAIIKPHPGMSYNPDFESHEKLLEKALEKAGAEEQDEQKNRELKARWQGVMNNTNDATTVMGMRVDTGEDEESDEQKNDDNLPVVPKQPGRKSSVQRRREMRAKAEYDAAQQRRKERRVRALMTELPACTKAESKLEKAKAELSEQKRQRKLEHMRQVGIAGHRIGKHTVPEPRVDVQTGDELSENFRRLKPEGNLFWDRFQSLQARGLAEARRPVQPKHQRRKTRTYDRHTFKRD